MFFLSSPASSYDLRYSYTPSVISLPPEQFFPLATPLREADLVSGSLVDVAVEAGDELAFAVNVTYFKIGVYFGFAIRCILQSPTICFALFC